MKFYTLILAFTHLLCVNASTLPVSSILNLNNSIETSKDGVVDFDGFDVCLDPIIGPTFHQNMSTPAWYDLGLETWSQVYAIVIYQGNIYVGGWFFDAGGVSDADHIAIWDGCSWQAVGGGMNNGVTSMVISGTDLYVGGYFTNTGPYLASWDGSQWNPTGGLNNTVTALGASVNGVVAAGLFTDAGGNANGDGVALWNGLSWENLGSGVSQTWYNALATNGTEIYLGGETVQGMLVWNGSSWDSVGLSGAVYDILIQGSDVYAGGCFTAAGGNPDANAIARWDGSTWHNLGSYFTTAMCVSALCLNGDALYAAVAAINSQWIMQWDLNAESWTQFPPGFPTSQWIDAMACDGSDLYVGVSDWGGAGLGSMWRWGEPAGEIIITGVPDSISCCDLPLALPTVQSGFTGNWLGWNVVDNVLYPGPGSGGGPEEYYFIPDGGCVPWGVLYYINVYYFGVDWDLPAFFCETDPPVNLDTMVFSLCDTTVAIPGTWSGPGITGNMFDPSGLSGWIFPIFFPDPSYACAEPVSRDVFIGAGQAPEITGIPSAVCEYHPPISLGTNHGGITGNWSGQGVTNNNFDPSGLNGIVLLTFTPDSGQCAEVVTFEITVNPNVEINITGIPDSLCGSNNPLVLPTSQNGISGQWSGQGVLNNIFNPFGLSGSIVLTFTPNPGQCADAVSTGIEVIPPTSVVVTGVPDSLCQSDPPLVLPGSLSGIVGQWNGQGVSNNTFNPLGLSGPVTLTFTPDPGPCALAANAIIVVQSLIVPLIPGVPSSICQTSMPIALPAPQNNITGTWSGQGVTNNLFNPAGLTGLVSFVFTPDAGQCASTAMHTITVISPTPPEITGIPSMLCETAPPIQLSTIHQGISGQWSGPGVQANLFDPEGLTGNIALTFTPDTGQCALPASIAIEVFSTFQPEITGIPGELCEESQSLALPDQVDSITGIWSGPGVIGFVFDPSGMNGIVVLTFTPAPDQCALEASIDIEIIESVAPQFVGLPDVICQDDPPFGLPTTENNIPGNWTGQGVSNNQFDPSGLSGQITLTFVPDTTQCAEVVMHDVSITTPAMPQITGIPPEVCQNDGVISLPGDVNLITGIWSGPGVVQNVFNPQGQTGIIVLTFNPDAGQCALPAQIQINVHSAPGFINLHTVCDSASQTYTVSFQITGGDPASYLVDGIPVSGPTFTSSPIDADWTEYSFLLDDGNGCGPVAINGTVHCGCATFAGTMDFSMSPLRVCDGSGFTVFHHGNAFLDADDKLQYVLHDGPGAVLGNILAVSDTSFFPYPNGVVQGQLYYVSPVAGSVDSLGNINLSDECLSISQGLPVIFDLPDVWIGPVQDVCSGACATYSLVFSGEPPFLLTYQVIVNSISYDRSISSDTNTTSITICPADFNVTDGTISLSPWDLSDAQCSVNLDALPMPFEVHSPSISLISYGLCAGESVSINGTTYDETHLAGTEVLPGAGMNGCDSILNIALWVEQPVFTDLSLTLCIDDSISVNGTQYSASNPSGIEVINGGAANGCDSIIQVDLSFDSVVVVNLDDILCADAFLEINGTIYNQDHPTGTETIPGIHTCDSVIDINLSFYPPAIHSLDLILCPGESVVVNHNTYDAEHPSGSELIPAGSIHGCDSVIEIRLQFYPDALGVIIDTLSPGDSLVINGMVYDQYNPVGTEFLPGQSAHGCDSIIDIMLVFQHVLSASVRTTDPICRGSATGMIICDSIIGIGSPYLIVINGSDSTLVSAFPVLIPNLSVGSYQVEVSDASGNSIVFDFQITDPPALHVDAGEDKIIMEGQSIQLTASADFVVADWEWTPQTFLSCTDCSNPFVDQADQTITYTATAIDINGCSASDQVSIFLDSQSEIFAPNVFSPNGDNLNDRWTLLTGRDDISLDQLIIYDRWGGILFRTTTAILNDPSSGWDGTSAGELVEPGVYVFAARLAYANGKNEMVSGSITLVR